MKSQSITHWPPKMYRNHIETKQVSLCDSTHNTNNYRIYTMYTHIHINCIKFLTTTTFNYILTGDTPGLSSLFGTSVLLSNVENSCDVFHWTLRTIHKISLHRRFLYSFIIHI